MLESQEQQRVLKLLEKLTAPTVKKSKQRLEVFLASSQIKPGFEHIKDWPAGWCMGWAFAADPSLAPGFDIAMTTRVVTVSKVKTVIKLWTQGSAFNFKESTIIHSHIPPSHETWQESLKLITHSLTIIEALPAVPATPELSRNCGKVKLKLCKSNGEKLLFHKQLELSQDEFIKFLLLGENYA